MTNIECWSKTEVNPPMAGKNGKGKSKKEKREDPYSLRFAVAGRG
ncbi:MAG: hypothetical protein ABII09_07105 [Planctomycetota bacterium]